MELIYFPHKPRFPTKLHCQNQIQFESKVHDYQNKEVTNRDDFSWEWKTGIICNQNCHIQLVIMAPSYKTHGGSHELCTDNHTTGIKAHFRQNDVAIKMKKRTLTMS
jgi:hypothetical protein